jgi:hypothetical protein
MNIKNVVIGIAIILLTIFVAIYGINTFYPRPEYDDFCEKIQTPMIITTQEECEGIEGEWNSDNYARPIENNIKGYCDRDFICRQDYDEARESYSQNLFLITLPLGIAIIIFGTLMFSLESVGAGLMGGGVGLILWGVTGFWEFAEDWLKFLLSLVGLIILIGLSYYFNKKLIKKKSKK